MMWLDFEFLIVWLGFLAYLCAIPFIDLFSLQFVVNKLELCQQQNFDLSSYSVRNQFVSDF